MSLTVQTPSGSSLSLPFEATTTVEALKQRMQEDTKLPVSRQQLSFNGQVMENARTMADYKVTDGAELVMKDMQAAGAAAVSAALWVGDLNADVTWQMLYEVFNPVAPVASIRVCRHHVTQESLGYAYVNFHSPADADKVLNTMNYTPISGRPCRIMWSQRDASSRRNGKGNIFIKNLNPEIDVQMLHDTFSKFGNVLSCKVALTRDGKPKGYGFVAFTNEDEAAAAIKAVDGKKLEGFQVQVTKYVPRTERSRQAEWNNVFVKDFPTTWTEEQLRAKFAPFGTISSLHFPTTEDGASTGFAFVCYEQHASAAAAAEKLNGETMKLPKTVTTKQEDGSTTTEEVVVEKPLYVGRAQKKSERQRQLEIKRSKDKQEREQMLTNRNLYVRNLDESVDEDKLKAEFEKYGKVMSVKIPKDDKGRSKLYGYVCFENQQDAAEAESNMNNQTLAGKPIAVFAWLSRAARKAQSAQNKRRDGAGAGPAAMGQRGMRGGAPNLMMMQQQMQQLQQAMMSGQVPPQQLQQMMMQNQQMQQMMYMAMMQQQQMQQHGMSAGQPMPPQQQQMMMQQQMQQAAAARAAPAQAQDSRSMAEVLAQSTPEQQRQIIGSALYRAVQQLQHDDATARKLTGMLLDSTGGDTGELLNLIESPEELRANVQEALKALQSA